MDPLAHPGASLSSLLARLPKKVDLYEVGPRDGLQNELRTLATADKVRLIEALVEAGEKRIEVTSFVSPKWIPQLADAEKVLAAIPRRDDVVYSALVPNLKGLERAKEAGLHEAAFFLSASESHSKKNINKTIAEAVQAAREVTTAATSAGMRVRGYVSVVWGCPYEGEVKVERVVELCRTLVDLGIYQLSLGDTIGVGTPGQTARILEALTRHIQVEQLALHLHDTRGTALANALIGLGGGVSTLDASVGGLGGCPYAPGAAGNLASEDLLFMLDGLGIDTGRRPLEAGRGRRARPGADRAEALGQVPAGGPRRAREGRREAARPDLTRCRHTAWNPRRGSRRARRDTMGKQAVGVIAGLWCVAAFAQGASAGEAPVVAKTDDERTLYALGRSIGKSLAPFDLSPEELRLVLQGMRDEQAHTPTMIDLGTAQGRIQALARARLAKAHAAAVKNAASEPGAVKLASGAIYRELDPGKGKRPTRRDVVVVEYQGRLVDGTVFDDTAPRGKPAEFPLDAVIPCWTEGLQRLAVGGKARLTCPAETAYGDAPPPGSRIPPGATLTFEVALKGIKG